MKTGMVLAPALLLPAFAALGQGLADDRGSEPSSLEAVTVNARRSLEQRFFSAGSLVVVDRKDIEELGAFSVADVLKQLPSTVVTTSGDGSVEIRMRGMDRNATQLLIDGQRVSSGRAQLPLDQLPAEMIERVEVVRAPTAEFSGATGGTINIVLREASVKRETAVRLTDNMVWGHHAGQAFFSRSGPIALGKGSKVDASPKLDEPASSSQEPWAYFVAVSSLGYLLGSDVRREVQEGSTSVTSDSSGRYRRRDIAIVPRLNGKIGASDQIALKATYNRSNQSGSYDSEGITSSTSAGSVPFSTDERYRFDRDFTQAGIDWSHRFKDSKLESSFAASRAREAVDRSGASTLMAGTGTLVTPLMFRDDRRESLRTASTKLTGTRDSLLWSLGGLIENRELGVFNETSGAAVDLRASVDRYVVWGQNEWDLSGNTLTAGLRSETVVTKSGFATGVPDKRSSGFLQPSLHLRMPINDESQFRANVARVTRNPRIWDLIDRRTLSQGSNSLANPDTVGNPDLKSETSWTVDAGYERRLPQQGQIGANIFVRLVSDAIASETRIAGGRWAERRINAGDAIVYGVEFDAKTGLTWLGLGRDWTLSANASLLQSRMTSGQSEGERIPGQPRYTVSVSIAKPIRRDGGFFGGGTLSVTGPSTLNTSPGITGREQARAAIDLYLGRVHKGLGYWRVGIFNVGDTPYRRSRSYTDAAGQLGLTTSNMTLTPRVYFAIGSNF